MPAAGDLEETQPQLRAEPLPSLRDRRRVPRE
jgi:hypothetical protein